MKKQRHIRTRLTFTLIGLTCAILLAVMLAFNIAVQSYIRSRVSTQLGEVTQNVFDDRREDGHGQKGDKHFDDRPDRVTGAEYSAVVLAEDGTLKRGLYGSDEASNELACYVRDHNLSAGTASKVVSLDSGTYAISIQADPVEADSLLLIYADVTSITTFSQRVNLILLIVIVAAILVSVLLSRHFAKSFAKPAQTLSDFASEIGGGKLDPRDLTFRDAEFQKLADSMNGMVQELSDAKRKQETFFQNVSHELRTPLTSIRGNAEGIVYGVIEPQKAGRVILSESDKLTGMVEDILYLSRMGRGRPEGSVEPIDLREVLSLCVSEQHTEAEKKGLSFSFDFDENPVMLAIREQDAQHLFGNLISNAVRYASKEIRLSCHSSGESAIIRVADDGPGIAEEDLPHVFERFYKGKDGKHGIGLAIAQSVAEAYQGTLTARNENGAVFEAAFRI
jgi:Signal transduction histidine kinase